MQRNVISNYSVLLGFVYGRRSKICTNKVSENFGKKISLAMQLCRINAKRSGRSILLMLKTI